MSEFNIDKIEMLTGDTADEGSLMAENERKHTPYETEVAFFSCIENGDTKGLQQMLESFFEQSVVVGRMSHDDLKQMKYFAVCCITLGTRAAIRGGVSERVAFNLSDEYIRKIDAMTRARDIPVFLYEKAVELSGLVSHFSRKRISHPTVKRAMHFIEENLYQKLTALQVAQYCDISKDHLRLLFTQNTGMTTAKYILLQKLRESRRLINRGFSNSQIAYQLGFCSESHFIAKYKQQYGKTPGEERKANC